MDENALLMSEFRGEWADWFEMIVTQIATHLNLKHLFESMPRIIKAVLKAKWGPTRY